MNELESAKELVKSKEAAARITKVAERLIDIEFVLASLSVEESVSKRIMQHVQPVLENTFLDGMSVGFDCASQISLACMRSRQG